ncbi:MAG: preprotein translocase subunit SecY [Clostridia bacterium]|nr:preprotein translocase subunit SecY [Clostridia bacterium]
MFKTFVNAWKIRDIRTKILFTLLLILLYRIGCYIPIPGVNVTSVAQSLEQYVAIGGFMNMFTGGAFANYAIFAMGISPYITGSIIMQLLTIAIPPLERLSKEEDGKQKIEKITRYVGVGLAAVQSITIILALGEDAVYDTGWLSYLTIGLTATAGTALLMWMGEKITEKGIGNGISFLIFASIAANVLPAATNIVSTVVTGSIHWLAIPIIVLVVLLLIVGIVCVDNAERRVPVNYAKRVKGRRQYGGASTHIPLKANANGVMPLIFAMTILNVPTIIIELAGDGWFATFWENTFATGRPAYYVLYALLIVGFAYFYSTISFNPVEIAKNIKENGGTILGIRPGWDTANYLKKIVSRLTLFGAIFLALVAVLPSIVFSFFDIGDLTAISMFGPTSVLILISVALETSRQLETQMMARHYKALL